MKQEELFHAETSWFAVLRTMIDSGDAAKLGGTAFLVYCVIKAHTNFSTGHSFPTLETIAEKAGLGSNDQVVRCIKKLEALGYISKEKTGRNNVYTLREKVTILDGEGKEAALASWDYRPSQMKQAMDDVRHVLLTGDFAGAKIVHIEHLQIIQGQHNTGVQNNPGIQISNDDLIKLPSDVQETLLQCHARFKAKTSKN